MSTDSNETGKAAAFFDVDGTLVSTTIVHYYIYFRRRALPPVIRSLWHVAFLIKCLYYLYLDTQSRTRVNEVFYRNYGGHDADTIRGQAGDCFEQAIRPHLFAQGSAKTAEHIDAGREVVLVTGSIDFLMAPLADHLGAGHVEAPGLLTENGNFTGALDGPPVGAEEKRKRVLAYAEAAGIDLAGSFAYGDSIADVPMLEVVGNPVAVNPDKALAAEAGRRGWPIERWSH